jgi:hypothetical protein
VLAEGRVRRWTLIGTVDPLRNPVAVLNAAWQLSVSAPPEATALLFNVRSTPVLRQLALAIAQSVVPDRILVPRGSGLERLGWPVGAEETEVAEAFPHVVIEAQRRARWLETAEQSEEHDVDLTKVTVDGARLGSGVRVELPGWAGWSEVSGGVLHLVGEREVTEEEAGQYLDQAHAARVSVVTPASYNGLVCSFASQEGEDFGIGFVREFLPERRLMKVRCTAVAPAPVRILRLGALRVDDTGRELGDVRAWTV